MINTNEISGIYEFNYTPCTEGCEYLIHNNGKLYHIKNENKETPSYEYTKNDVLLEFIKNATQVLIAEMRQ